MTSSRMHTHKRILAEHSVAPFGIWLRLILSLRPYGAQARFQNEMHAVKHVTQIPETD